MLVSGRKLKLKVRVAEFFEQMQGSPEFQLLPLTYAIASEAAGLTALRDPADRVIVATARVHGLQLVSSDQRIIESRYVSVVE